MDDPGNLTRSKAMQDTTRIGYYKAYLSQLKKAADDGANLVG
jgi:beta-glucosidase